MRILLAEDERTLHRILKKRLTEEGWSVDGCFDGEETLDYLRAAPYDAVILDVMMSKRDGFSVLAEARREGIDAPVLFLTARDGIEDRVRGLDLGASDYLVKPFAMAELLARVRALLRRSGGTAGSVLTAGDVRLDLAAHTVTRGGEPVALSAREYALLEYLMHNKNHVLSREQIEDHIWNADYEGGTNVVDVYISYLRKKLDGGRAEKLILTMRGRGYMLRDPGKDGGEE